MTSAEATHPESGFTLEHARESRRRALSDEQAALREADSLRSDLAAAEARAEKYGNLRSVLEAIYPQLQEEPVEGSHVGDADDGALALTEPSASETRSNEARTDARVFDVAALVLNTLRDRQGEWVRPGDLADELAYAMPDTGSPTAKIRRILRDLKDNDGCVEVTAIDGRSKAYRLSDDSSTT